MSLVGRLVMVGFRGPTLPAEVRSWIEREDLAGVFLWPPHGNLESPDQVRALTAEIRKAGNGRPVRIAIDQEGGRVQAWGPPHEPPLPSAREIGALARTSGGDAFVRAHGAAVGRRLADLGIDVDFAPVLDVDTEPTNPIIGDRSFSSDPGEVARDAVAFAVGLGEAGILACGKHFPGHGDTTADSHVDLPIVGCDRDRLDAVELVPFRAAIVARFPLLMTAHVRYPVLDREAPATRSSAILGRLLREELGFEGAVVTDDLGMAGIRREADLLEAALGALDAGCDLLLSTAETEAHAGLLDGLETARSRGRLSDERLEASARRLAALTPVAPRHRLRA